VAHFPFAGMFDEFIQDATVARMAPLEATLFAATSHQHLQRFGRLKQPTTMLLVAAARTGSVALMGELLREWMPSAFRETAVKAEAHRRPENQKGRTSRPQDGLMRLRV